METVEVLVRIPKDEYDYIQLYGSIKPFSAKQIINGTVLPKGHGRLIDADALESEFDMLEKVTNEGSLVERAEHKKLLECISIAKTAQTIIEADKAESEG